MDITDISVRITGDDVMTFIASGQPMVISDDIKARLNKVRTYLEEKSATRKAPIYGVNTGFGSLCNTVIAADELGPYSVTCSCRTPVAWALKFRKT